MRVARQFLISGRVQAVGFRSFAESAATREGVQGWVRNLPDGRIEIVAEGHAVAMTRFERHLRDGPRNARVDHVHVEEKTPSDLDTGFAIK